MIPRRSHFCGVFLLSCHVIFNKENVKIFYTLTRKFRIDFCVKYVIFLAWATNGREPAQLRSKSLRKLPYTEVSQLDNSILSQMCPPHKEKSEDL